MPFDAYDRVLLPTTRSRMIVRAAEDERVKVDDGTEEKWVIDGTSQVGTNPLGHRNQELLAAWEELHDTAQEPLMVAGNDVYHPFQRELGELFTEIYPGNLSYGDLKTYFCNSGSEAVERGCLKAAQLYQGGNTYVAFDNAFHGRTSLALSCNFSKAAHTERYNSLFRSLPVPYADHRTDCDDALQRLQELITREGPANVNAVIVEPVQGEGGYNVPDDGFLPGVREITADHGIPLVMDEVQASIRTGAWFACQHWDVQPDMIAVAKAFSGGMTPFGASLIRDEYATDQDGKHSSTFGGNPQDCYAALKTVQIIRDNDYLAHAAAMGERFDAAWRDLTDQDAVVDERGLGVMRGIEFADAATRDAVLQELFGEHDILTMPCGNDRINPAIRFLLPVNVAEEVVEQIITAVPAAIRSVQ